MKNKLAEVGYEYHFSSKQGGGSYVVTGHVNCERCNELVEDREQLEPSKKHRQKGRYYYHYYWCDNCGLYKPDESSLTHIKNYKII